MAIPADPIVIQGIAWLPWLLIFPASILLWHHKTRTLGLGVAACGFIAALAVGQLTATALIAFAFLGFAGAAVSRGPTLVWRASGHATFLLTAIALRLHVVPGFENPLAIHAVFSEGAVPFKAYLNLDKTLTGVWIVAFVSSIDTNGPVLKRLGAGALIGLTTFLIVGAIAMALGVVRLEPKLHEVAWLWAINNILLVCFAEEAFFRGYLQAGLSRFLHGRRYADAIAILAISLIFGFVHFGQPLAMQLLSVMAAIGYGLAYLRHGLIGAIAAHATLNLCHFFLLTYPLLK